ncbi:MAG: hypothetical protein HYX78_13525 [Armatimonadetes bacterium]|nr:hypothetical protein [Armatimonadota bacterium]
MRLTNIQKIDRRIIYLLLVVVVAVPIIWDFLRQPLEMSRDVTGVYDAVERIPKGKIAIISAYWSAGTLAENRPQTEAIMEHLFRKDVPFAIIPWDQLGTTLVYNSADKIAKEMGKEYGKDWISFGYQPIVIVGYFEQVAQAMPLDMHGTFKTDKFDTPLSKIPMMRGIRTARDIGLLVDVTPSGTVQAWISFLGQPYKVPIAYAPTGVMVAEGYNYLDAKQIVGMLPGLIGAAKYEMLLEERGFALRAANALSTSHVLIIALIVLGNVGYFLSRRQRQRM